MSVLFISSELPEDLRADLEREFEVVDVPDEADDDLASFGAPAGWLVAGRPVTAHHLGQLPTLRVVSNYGVGYDSVDVDAATAVGVKVGNTPGVLDNAVAELTLGLVIALGRGIVRLDTYVKSGEWVKAWPPLTNDVHGKTLGVLGMGRIGLRLAELVRPLGMRVVYHNRGRSSRIDATGLAEYLDWDEFLAESDFVSVHTPLTERTRGFFTGEDLAKMKETAYLINMARGPVIRTPDLVSALRSGQIAGAALDVFDEEPLPLDSPLYELDNVILLPHMGSATSETRRAMIEVAVANLVRGARGEDLHAPVN